ncbi:MAG: hypothetical protein ACP5KV_03850 [Candidatus Methanomethylicaceae archaeon]
MPVALRYRICPKPRQEGLLKSHLSSLCHLYNNLRDIDKIKKRGTSVPASQRTT